MLFNNDLHNHLTYSNCILFTDDTTLYSTYHDLRHLTWCIREDLITMTDWFKANKLTLNLDKSVCMLFSNNNNTVMSPCLKELGLPIVDHMKFLGVFIDNRLSWVAQFNHVMLKIKRNLQMLKSGKNLLNLQAKRCLYYGHIYSHISYCISTWGPMLQQTQIKKLQQIQNKSVNLIDTSRTRMMQKFTKLKLFTIGQIIDLELSKIGYKFLKKELPIRIMESLSTDAKFKDLRKIHKYSTL